MTAFWQLAHQGAHTRRIAGMVVVAPAVTLLVTGLFNFLVHRQFTWQPEEHTADANFVQAILVPGILFLLVFSLRWLTGDTLAKTLFVSFFTTPLAICGVSLLSGDSGTGAMVFYLLTTVSVAYFWRVAVSIAYMALSSCAAFVHLILTQPLQLALTNWLVLTLVIVGISGSFSFMRARRDLMEQELRHSIMHDALTGLASREKLTSYLQTVNARGPSPTGHALILLDIDRFKEINDTHGHPGGDEVLQAIAQSISQVLASDELACRMGGDELAIFLPGADRQRAEDRADTIDQAINQTQVRLTTGVVISVRASVGVAHTFVNELDFNTLYHTADRRLYEVKRRRSSVSRSVAPLTEPQTCTEGGR